MLADIAWSKGQGDEVRSELETARSLVRGRRPSRTQAAVLESEAARYTLADRNDRAITVGREALRLCEELGLDDISTRALNNVGAARVCSGDPEGIADLEQSIKLAVKVNSAADSSAATTTSGR